MTKDEEAAVKNIHEAVQMVPSGSTMLEISYKDPLLCAEEITVTLDDQVVAKDENMSLGARTHGVIGSYVTTFGNHKLEVMVKTYGVKGVISTIAGDCCFSPKSENSLVIDVWSRGYLPRILLDGAYLNSPGGLRFQESAEWDSIVSKAHSVPSWRGNLIFSVSKALTARYQVWIDGIEISDRVPRVSFGSISLAFGKHTLTVCNATTGTILYDGELHIGWAFTYTLNLSLDGEYVEIEDADHKVIYDSRLCKNAFTQDIKPVIPDSKAEQPSENTEEPQNKNGDTGSESKNP